MGAPVSSGRPWLWRAPLARCASNLAQRASMCVWRPHVDILWERAWVECAAKFLCFHARCLLARMSRVVLSFQSPICVLFCVSAAVASWAFGLRFQRCGLLFGESPESQRPLLSPLCLPWLCSDVLVFDVARSVEVTSHCDNMIV